MGEVIMNIIETLINEYPELTENDFSVCGKIRVQDDSDGQGAYIAKWDYDKPIPEGLTLGKPSA
jgi:hypothetical protein